MNHKLPAQPENEHRLSRRTALWGAVWSAPAVALTVASPAGAAESGLPCAAAVGPGTLAGGIGVDMSPSTFTWPHTVSDQDTRTGTILGLAGSQWGLSSDFLRLDAATSAAVKAYNTAVNGIPGSTQILSGTLTIHNVHINSMLVSMQTDPIVPRPVGTGLDGLPDGEYRQLAAGGGCQVVSVPISGVTLVEQPDGLLYLQGWQSTAMYSAAAFVNQWLTASVFNYWSSVFNTAPYAVNGRPDILPVSTPGTASVLDGSIQASGFSFVAQYSCSGESRTFVALQPEVPC